jgi:hypothetical protein
MMLGKEAFARGAVELSPGTATGMAVGTKVAQPEPAAIATARMGTEVLGSIYRAGASVRWWHRVGSYGRGRLGMRDVLLTQGTVWFLSQAGKRFGGVGALAAWRDGYSWMRVSGVLARPGIKQQEEQPHRCDTMATPPHIDVKEGHCTRLSGQDNYPQRPGTRPLLYD